MSKLVHEIAERIKAEHGLIPGDIYRLDIAPMDLDLHNAEDAFVAGYLMAQTRYYLTIRRHQERILNATYIDGKMVRNT